MGAVAPQGIMYFPMSDYRYAVLQHEDEPFFNEQIQIAFSRTDIISDSLGVSDKALVVRIYDKVKIQCLRRQRHIQESICIKHLFAQHTFFCHLTIPPISFALLISCVAFPENGLYIATRSLFLSKLCLIKFPLSCCCFYTIPMEHTP